MNSLDIKLKIVSEPGPANNNSAEPIERGESFDDVLSREIEDQSDLISADSIQQEPAQESGEGNRQSESENTVANVWIGITAIQILPTAQSSQSISDAQVDSQSKVSGMVIANPQSSAMKDLTALASFSSVSSDRGTENSAQGLVEQVPLRRQSISQESASKPASVKGVGTDRTDPGSNLSVWAKTSTVVEKNIESVISQIHFSGSDNTDARSSSTNVQTINASFLATSQTGSSTPAANTNITLASITTPLQNQAWGEQLVQQVRQFTLQKIGVAEIQITPQELGPIRVEIALDKNEAAIHFSAQHQETRDILSQQINRLKEALSEAGVQLQSATTGSYSDGQAFSFLQQQARERDTGSRPKNDASRTQHAEITAMAPSGSGVISKTVRAGIDLFA
jgi:flagellar hook-length control protein FliK